MIATEYPFWFIYAVYLGLYCPFYPAIAISICAIVAASSERKTSKQKRAAWLASAWLWGGAVVIYFTIWKPMVFGPI